MGVAIAHFTLLGLTVAIPVTDSQSWDLAVERDGLQRVQVKTTFCRTPSGRFSVELRTKGGNKTGETVKKFCASQADWLFVVTADNEKYFIPARELDGKSACVLTSAWDVWRV